MPASQLLCSRQPTRNSTRIPVDRSLRKHGHSEQVVIVRDNWNLKLPWLNQSPSIRDDCDAGRGEVTTRRISPGINIGTCSRYCAYSGCTFITSRSSNCIAIKMYAVVTRAKKKWVTVMVGVHQNARNQPT